MKLDLFCTKIACEYMYLKEQIGSAPTWVVKDEMKTKLENLKLILIKRVGSKRARILMRELKSWY